MYLAALSLAAGRAAARGGPMRLPAARLAFAPAPGLRRRPCALRAEASSGRGSAAVAKAAGGAKPSSKADLAAPKGTRDLYPADMRVRTWLFGQWRRVAALHGFEEYDAPLLETEALYIRKAGEEVTEQLYNFEDKGGRRVALRPEMTPSLARMVVARRGALALPLKWFSIPQCWRYERMSRGRRREHYQWNMDVWGTEGVEAEAELLAAMVEFFSGVGLVPADLAVRVSSRAVLGEILASLGVDDASFAPVCVVVDKLEKVSARRGRKKKKRTPNAARP